MITTPAPSKNTNRRRRKSTLQLMKDIEQSNAAEVKKALEAVAKLTGVRKQH